VQHSDPDVLALVALGERPPAADAEHLLECERCRADVEELRQVVSAVRVDVPPGPPVAPPERVWHHIAAATGVRAAPRLERDHVPPSSPGSPVPQPGPDELAVRRGRRAGTGVRTLVAVAAAALVVGVAGGVVGSRLLDRDPVVAQPSGRQVVAQVALSNLKPAVTDASGSASVVNTGSGRRLVLDVSQLSPVPGHFYEVWLIDKDVKKMVSLGILDGSTGQFTIPDGVDISAYPVVDISVQEPGDPKHSGDSVLRGVIKT
jgi:anti-sigma factor RsiW